MILRGWLSEKKEIEQSFEWGYPLIKVGLYPIFRFKKDIKEYRFSKNPIRVKITIEEDKNEVKR